MKDIQLSLLNLTVLAHGLFKDMKNIQSLTLMTMVVMVYTAAIPLPKLEEIKRHATNLTALANGTNIQVAKVSTNQNGPCVKEFFCLAEKALVNAEHLFKNESMVLRDSMETLKRSLNKQGGDNCTLNTDSTHHVTKFLEDIKKCADSLIKQGVKA